jgi:hypothetical protein
MSRHPVEGIPALGGAPQVIRPGLRTALATLPGALLRRDILVVTALVVVAALVRLADLASRGTWDKDQGHDMLVLRAFVQDGVVPLLGPPTSIGDVHHGAWYYYLLAPSAAVSGAAPEAVVSALAVFSIAAVAVTWWVARQLGGPVAGLAAGLLMALSATAIEQSTFIWNPNILALTSSIALAGAWRAWATGRARWWLVAAVGLALTMQGHVLGAVLLPPFAGLLLADARRRAARDDGAGRRVIAAGLGGLVILVVAFLPLLVHELTRDFGETRAALAYLRDGGRETALGPLERTLLVGLRSLAWPLTGLVTNAFAASAVAAAATLAILAMRGRWAAGTERAAMRWAAATLAWCTLALALLAPGLATVTPGLPNDHYHSFLDPLVFVVVGIGVAALWNAGQPMGRALAAAGLGSLLVFNVGSWPPPVAEDGGWPAARGAGERVITVTGERTIALVGLPDFKEPDALGFPLAARGAQLVAPGAAGDAGALVIVCDSLFETAIGDTCGGPAEDAAAGRLPGFGPLVDRFTIPAASPRTTISVYLARSSEP